MHTDKVLIVGPSWVGDMVMAQCLFKLLKQQYPQIIIDVLAPAWSAPLLERMPEVRHAIAMPVGHGEIQMGVRFSLGKSLRQEKYTQAIVLPNSFKSALVPAFAKIPIRTGWRGEMRYGLLNDIRVLDKQVYPKMIQRFAALAFTKDATPVNDIPLPAFTIQETDVDRALQKFSLSTDKPILALCPGAEFGPAKRWPSEHYASVAQTYLAKGCQVWIFGSRNDTPVAQSILELTSHQCIDLTGKTLLSEAIDLLSVAQLVVTNDSGLMHISAALKRPLVVLYGSTDPGFTPPLSEQVKIVSLNLPCSPCFKRECPLGHLNCLKTLTPEHVLAAANTLAVLPTVNKQPSETSLMQGTDVELTG